MLSPLPGTEDATRDRLHRGGLVHAGLAHPHIVGVLAVGDVDGQVFIAMELVRGRDLRELIARRELDAGRALRLLGQVADALDAVHAAGVIHRAVKPSNVLVGPGDHAYLTDFGLMLEAGDVMTRTGEFVGAVSYAAPEQITGDATTAQADIYSLGVVLYEALTGDLPFRSDSVAAVLRAHVTEQPPRVTDVRPELPAALDAVVAAAMAKDPRYRPTSAVAMLRDAERALAGAESPRIAGSAQDAKLRALLTERCASGGGGGARGRVGARDRDPPDRRTRSTAGSRSRSTAGRPAEAPGRSDSATAAPDRRPVDRCRGRRSPAHARRGALGPGPVVDVRPPGSARRVRARRAGRHRRGAEVDGALHARDRPRGSRMTSSTPSTAPSSRRQRSPPARRC